jgi:hypothetical protein
MLDVQYIFFVKVASPAYMKNREPVDYTLFAKVYNRPHRLLTDPIFLDRIPDPDPFENWI